MAVFTGLTRGKLKGFRTATRRFIMEVRREAENGTPVAPLPEILAGITQKLQQEQHAWRQRLQADPRQFGAVEVAVHHTFQQLADQLVAGLLTDIGQSGALETPSKKSR
jgi:hypothetical protein